MTSATYREAATPNATETARMQDPDNRLLWRCETRRLDSEQIRDAMLLVSGELKLDAGGPSVDASAPRRSVYTKILRNHPDPLLDAFDSPDSFGSVCTRNVTTTPTQSLLLMNGDWPLKRAAAFARRVHAEAKSAAPGDLVECAYRLAYGRAPQADERSTGIEFLQAGAIDETLVDFCHVLFNSNEFLYVD
jgi:hypothetical protein